jgi:CRISPR system Cascade subunit CasD
MPTPHQEATLVIRLAGPQQSWGVAGIGDVRPSATRPTKSGVAGLIAAALGRSTEEPRDDLMALRMEVHVVRPGYLEEDFQVTQNIIRTDQSGRQPTAISWRQYLADAEFLVALTGDRALLKQIEAALQRPVIAPSLGRRGYFPTKPLLAGKAGKMSAGIAFNRAIEEDIFAGN